MKPLLVLIVPLGVLVLLITSTIGGELIVEFLGPSSTSIEAAGIVANVTLTAGLILIYAMMASDQSSQTNASMRQTEILEKQQQLLEAKFIPEIDIESITGSDMQILLSCANKGGGPAKNLHIDPTYYIETEDGQTKRLEDFGGENETEDDSMPNYYWGFEDQTIPFHRIARDSMIRREGGEIIEGGEQTELGGTPKLKVYGGHDPSNFEYQSLVTALDSLAQHGAQKFGYQFTLKYEDYFGEEGDPINLGNGGVRISEVDSMADLLDAREGTLVGESGHGRYHHIYIDLEPDGP